MASVWKHPKSKYWTAVYRDEAGRWRRCTTKRTSQRQAITIARAHEERAALLRDDHLAAEAFDLEVARQRERLFGQRTARTARQYLTAWLEGKTVARSEGTSLRYATTVARFLDVLGSRADKPLAHVKPADCQAFYNQLCASNHAPATCVVELKTLRTIFNAARREQLLAFNPAEAVELPRHVRQVQRKTLTPAQVEILLAEAAQKQPEWQTAILLGYYAGMRLSDAITRTWDNVNFQAHTLSYRQKKTGETLHVPLHPRLEEHLAALAGDATGRITPELAGVPTGGRSGLSKQFLAIMRRAGISADSDATGGQRKLSRISFHSLRKTFNSDLHNLGVSQELRKKLTGHKSSAVNDRYTHTELDTLRAAVERLPKLERPAGAQLPLFKGDR